MPNIPAGGCYIEAGKVTEGSSSIPLLLDAHLTLAVHRRRKPAEWSKVSESWRRFRRRVLHTFYFISFYCRRKMNVSKKKLGEKGSKKNKVFIDFFVHPTFAPYPIVLLLPRGITLLLFFDK